MCRLWLTVGALVLAACQPAKISGNSGLPGAAGSGNGSGGSGGAAPGGNGPG
jgi:hypothetical protein